MKLEEMLPLLGTDAGSWGMIRGVVASEATPDGISVRCDLEDIVEVACDLLQVADGPPLRLVVGEPVLLLLSGSERRGYILGRILQPTTAEPAEKPDELVLEASHSLTLRVGDGSITIREDGKILIKGKDLVSHATRRNRIKGGSVEIN
jgi:hypothetical protein